MELDLAAKQEWLKERKTYIGGTDCAAICGVNPYKSPLSVYLDKTSPEIEDSILSTAMECGILLEDTVAKLYQIKTGNKIEISTTLLRHPEYNFVAGNIDRWVNDKEYVLECKTTGFMKAKEWGDEGTDQIPEFYLIQVAWYAAICNVPKVDIAVLIGGQDFRIYTYVRNKEFEDKLIKIACNFWNNNVLKQIPPDAQSIQDTIALYPVSNGREIKANSIIISKMNTLKDLKNQEKGLNIAIQELVFEIKEYMKDHDLLVDGTGNCLATWKNSVPKTAIDLKKLQEEKPDLYIQYMKENKISRTFLIK